MTHIMRSATVVLRGLGLGAIVAVSLSGVLRNYSVRGDLFRLRVMCRDAGPHTITRS